MTTTTFNAFSVFTEQTADLGELERRFRIASENQQQAWREYSCHTIEEGYSVEETQAYLMTALAADRAQKEAYEAREAWHIANLRNDAAPEPFEYDDPDVRADLYYTI